MTASSSPPPLNPRPSKPFPWVWVILLCVGVLPTAFFLIVATITYVQPTKYMGRTSIQINREPFTPKSGEDWPAREFQGFIKTELKVISSQATLARAVEDLKLDERWNLSQAQAIARLQANLETEEEKGTDIIVIRYFDPDPRTAAEVANAVTLAYKNGRRERFSEEIRRKMELLRIQVREQQDKVDQARLKMVEAAERFRATDVASVDSKPSLRENLFAGTDVILDESRLAALKNRSGDALIDAVAALKLPGQEGKDFEEWEKLRFELDVLTRAGLAKDHPIVKAVEAKLADRRTALEEKAQQLCAPAEAESTKIAEAKKAEPGKFSEFLKARNEHEAQTDLLGRMKDNYAAEGMGISQPFAEEHEVAEPPTRPAKPNVALNLILGLVGGGFLGVASLVAILFFSAFRKRR